MERPDLQRDDVEPLLEVYLGVLLDVLRLGQQPADEHDHGPRLLALPARLLVRRRRDELERHGLVERLGRLGQGRVEPVVQPDRVQLVRRQEVLDELQRTQKEGERERKRDMREGGREGEMERGREREREEERERDERGRKRERERWERERERNKQMIRFVKTEKTTQDSSC